MGYIAFMAVLFGAAGVAGGIETSSIVGIVISAVIHISGIIGMAVAVKNEGETDEDQEDDSDDLGGSSPVDKPYS